MLSHCNVLINYEKSHILFITNNSMCYSRFEISPMITQHLFTWDLRNKRKKNRGDNAQTLSNMYENTTESCKFQWKKKNKKYEKFLDPIPFVWNISIYQFLVRHLMFPLVSIHTTMNTSSNTSEEQRVTSSDCSSLINHFTVHYTTLCHIVI